MLAQTPGIDSLKSILENHTAKDTARVNLLNKIGYALYSRDAEASKNYAAESFQLATELGYAKGKAESLWLQGITCIQQDPGNAMGLFEKLGQYRQHLLCPKRFLQGYGIQSESCRDCLKIRS